MVALEKRLLKSRIPYRNMNSVAAEEMKMKSFWVEPELSLGGHFDV
jgi:hypothetical protein